MTADEYAWTDEQARKFTAPCVDRWQWDAWLASHDARVRRDAAREALDQLERAEARIAEEKRLRMKATAAATEAEHRIARLEAQTDIRGRAVVMYRERAREAEARIEAVRGVHTGTVWPGVGDKPICDACDQMWPCATIRALEG